MSHIAQATVEWPSLFFGPVNLWSLQPAWKRDHADIRPPAKPTFAAKVSSSVEVNPVIANILAHR